MTVLKYINMARSYGFENIINDDLIINISCTAGLLKTLNLSFSIVYSFLALYVLEL